MGNDRHSYVEFYPSDWVGGCATLSPMAEWVYLQVCLYNWDKVEPMPAKLIPDHMIRHKGWRADLAKLIDIGKLHQTAGGAVFSKKALGVADKAYSLWERKSRGGKNGQQSLKESKARVMAKTHSQDSSQVTETESETETNDNLKVVPPIIPQPDLLFIPPEPQWQQFREFRQHMKRPMSEHAEKLMSRELAKLQHDGHDPAAVIEQSIMNGYQGLFPLKEDRRDRANGKKSGWGDWP